MSFCLNVLIDQKTRHISTNNLGIKELSICGHRLKSSANVYEVSITKDYVIVTTQETVRKRSILFNTRPEYRTSINAYDWEGNHMWNVTDIIGNTEMHIWGGTVSTKELLKGHPDFDELKCDDNCELYCCTADSREFIINLSNLKVIQVLETR